MAAVEEVVAPVAAAAAAAVVELLADFLGIGEPETERRRVARTAMVEYENCMVMID